MLDTVIFRIHDLKLHQPVCEFLNKKITKTGMSIYQVEGSTDFTEGVKRIHKTYLMYHDTGNLLEKAHFDKLKSSHYLIAYQIDYLRDFINFNVSIPKYAFGTNVLLYTYPPNSKKFDFFKNGSIETNLNQSFDLLHHFFDKFFINEFGTLTIYKSFVEINRLDFCYNQTFLSKQDALNYLKQLKEIRKKYTRDSSNYSRAWASSIMFVTKRYSFKVYHKGSEFKKKDFKELSKLNTHLDLEFYQDFADKILRYEMSFRGSYFSYLFMQHIFRKDCEIWQFGLKLFKLDKKKQEKPQYLQWRQSLEKEEIKAISYVKSILFKTKVFYLSAKDFDNKTYDIETNHNNYWEFPQKKEQFYIPTHFSRSLFNLAAKTFLKNILEFKLETKNSNTEILKNLDTYNHTAQNKKQIILKTSGLEKNKNLVPRQISRSKIVMLLELLEKYTFEEIEANKLFSRMTMYRYKKDLEMLGLTNRNLLNLTLNADFDLKRYNNNIMYNLSKFPYLKFVII